MDDTLVLYDGDCGLCARSVQFILDHEAHPTLRFAALSSPIGLRLRKKFGIADTDSMIVITANTALLRSTAAVHIASHLRAPWSWLRILRWLPRWLREGLYRLVARTRRWWPAATCRIPDAATRARFITD